MILPILSVTTVNTLSEFEFWIHWISSSFKNSGIHPASSIYQGTQSCHNADCSFNSHHINDCNNSVHRLKKNGMRIINPDNTKNVVNKYVIKIQNHLLFVILCQKIMHHSKASEIINAAITISIYDRDIYIIYHKVTSANHINQNFNINLVVFADWALTSAWFSSKRCVSGFSKFGLGKRFLYFSFKSSFHE